MTNTTTISNLQTEDYINGYLQIESQLKDKMYFGEMFGFVKKAFSMGCEGTMLKALHRRLFTVSRSFEVPILLISMCMWDRCEQLSGLPKYN